MCIYTSDGKDAKPRINKSEHKINVDRTRSLQETAIEIKDGKVDIFANDCIEDFIRHHLNIAEVREEDKHGKVKTVMKRLGEDHLLHADNYSRLLGGKSTSQVFVF